MPTYIQDAWRNKDKGILLDGLLCLSLKGTPKDWNVANNGHFFIDFLDILSQQTSQKKSIAIRHLNSRKSQISPNKDRLLDIIGYNGNSLVEVS